MDGLFVIVILGGVVSAVGGLLFWGAIVWLGLKAARAANSGGFPGAPPGIDPQFAQLMAQIQTLVAQAQAAPQQQPHGLDSMVQPSLPPHLQAQFSAKVLQAQQQLRDMDRLAQQRHDLFVSGMLSDASAAGLDVSSWRR